ncbi:hypothetical protein [Glycomyces halotolerans]
MSNPPELIESGLEVLIDYAKRGETLTYGALNRELDRPFSPANLRGRIGPLCDDINDLHDAKTGLPFMISALVHNERTRQPSEGFFKLAAERQFLPLTDDPDTRRAFVAAQLTAIHAHYQPR